MPIEFINQDISTKEGWEGFIASLQSYVTKTASGGELRFADVTLILTCDPFTGEKFERPAIHVIATAFGGEGDEQVEISKDDFNFIVRAWAVAGHAIGSIFTSEVWMTTISTKDGILPEHLPPSKDPARKEAVIMTVEHTQFGTAMHQAFISKDADKRILSEWTTSPGQLAGRFAGFIPPAVVQDHPAVIEASRMFINNTGAQACVRDAKDRLQS